MGSPINLLRSAGRAVDDRLVRTATRRLLAGVAVIAFGGLLIPQAAGAAFSLMTSFGGSGEGIFAPAVTGLTVDAKGDVYVVDGGVTSRIEEFSATGAFMAKWGTEGEGAGEMDLPEGIAIAAGGSDAGDVYVADAGNRRVDEFGPEGKFIRTWGWGVKDGNVEFEICTAGCRKGLPHGEDEGGFENPVGVAVDPTSGDVYVSDASGVLRWPIQKFSPSGAFLKEVGLAESIHGPVGGAFSEPDALATSSSGDLYVVDGGNERIQELGPGEEFLRMWGRGVQNGELHFEVCTEAAPKECRIGAQGEEAGAFAFIGGAPVSIAIDPSGDVWVPDPSNERVQEFTSEGAFVMGFVWGVSDGAESFETCTSKCRAGLKGVRPTEFEKPLGAAAAPSGCGIYVTDANADDLVDEFGDPSSAACGGTAEPEPAHKEETPTNNGGGSPGNTSGSSPGITSTTPGIAATPQAIEELLLGCSKHALVLNDVLIRGGRVALDGSAARSLDGKKVKIIFDGDKQVATATVGANGQFSTTAPLPPARLRDSNSARYTAEAGSQRSLNLKLTRRLSLEPPKFAGGTVTLVGQVVPPLTKPIASVTVEQVLECGRSSIAKRFRPPASGHFRISLAVPTAAKAGIYRLTSSVTEKPGAKHGFATYSLPLPVILS